ncbi:winged helix-turn-helix transcriptional regulator [Cellulomonas soli]
MRSYDQFCGLAYALDVIGDRWNLLVVRELLLGPRRHRDLVEALPGVASNLLGDRLRALEDAGIVARDAADGRKSVVYSLTPAARTCASRSSPSCAGAAVRWPPDPGPTTPSDRPGSGSPSRRC